MSPHEFIESLHRHYAKRHQSDEAEAKWLKEMIAVVSGNDERVMRKAYELIRDEHDERAFPLPATLKKYISRAAEIIYPERPGQSYTMPFKRTCMPPTRAEVEAYERAAAWQAAEIKRYGSWESQWKATRHLFVKNNKKIHAPPIERKPPASMPLARVRKIRFLKPTFSRPVMQALMRSSPNQGLYVDHAKLTRRITGERE